MNEGHDADLQQALVEVDESHICHLLRNVLASLQICCRKRSPESSAGKDESATVLKRLVERCISVLDRTAALSSCSDFILPEALTILQAALHGQQAVAEAILSTHLLSLLSVPPAADLVMLSMSANPEGMTMLYVKMHQLLLDGEVAVDLLKNPLCVRHLRRELGRLIPGLKDGRQMGSCKASVDLTPHLPHLLGIAIILGLEDERPEEESQTQNSHASQSTQFPSGQPHQTAPTEGQGAGFKPGGEVPKFAAQVVAEILRFLCDERVLMTQLGVRALGGQMLDLPEPGSMAIVLHAGVSSPESAGKGSQAKHDEHAQICQLLVEVILQLFSSNPQMGKYALSLLEKRGQRQGEDSTAPGSGSSSVTVKVRTTKPLNPPRVPSQVESAALATQQLESMAVDLLCLHLQLSRLKSSSTELKQWQLKLLSQDNLEWLCKLVLKELQHGRSGISSVGRRSSRHAGGVPSGAGGNALCIPPQAAAHLLTMLREAYSSKLAQDADCAKGDAPGLAKLAVQYSTVSVQGPEAKVCYVSKLASACALERHLDQQQQGAYPILCAADTPTCQQRDLMQSPAKRQKLSHNVTLDGLRSNQNRSEAATSEKPPSKPQDQGEKRMVSRFKPQQNAVACHGSQQIGGVGCSAASGQLPQPHAKPSRRIAPTLVVKEEQVEIPDLLLEQKQKDEAYWEKYIQVKEEFVNQVLQDEMEDGNDAEPYVGSPPSAAAGKSRPGLIGSASKTSIESTAFREKDWQNLHAAALCLLAVALRVLCKQPHPASSTWQALDEEPAWSDAKLLAFKGLRFISPHVSSGPRFSAIVAGAKALPRECRVLGITVTMASYCLTPGPPLTPDLTAGFLAVLKPLIATCVLDQERQDRTTGGWNLKLTKPLSVVGELLMVILDRGQGLDGGLLEAAVKLQFCDCILSAHSPSMKLPLLASAMGAILQPHMEVAEGDNGWISLHRPGWVKFWGRLQKKQDARNLCGKLLEKLINDPVLRDDSSVHESAVPLRAEAETVERFDALAYVAGALRMYCTLIPQKGKEIVTGSGLGSLLKAARSVLGQAHTCSQALQRTFSVSVHEEAKDEELWNIAFFIGMADKMSVACHSLLTWREKTCPLREKTPAHELQRTCLDFDENYQDLLTDIDSTRNLNAEQKEGMREALVDCLSVEQDQERHAQLAGSQWGASNDESSPKRKGKSWRPSNAYLKAALAEDRPGAFTDGEEDDCSYSDLEDFIVCKPDRDYETLIAREFKYTDDGY